MNSNLRPRLILVPTDFSEMAGHAIRYASALAQRMDAHLLVLYSEFFMPPIDFMATAAGECSVAREYLIGEAREHLQRHAEMNIDARVPFDTRVMERAPVEAILDVAKETGADLIVMGTHGRTGVSRLVVGSTTETIMRMAAIPVIAVNRSSTDAGEIRKILCPVDYTDAQLTALRFAAAIVNTRSAPIVLIRTIDDVDDPRAHATELRRLHDWIPPELVDRCELKIVPAQATADSILTLASSTHPDLIVLGTSPHRSLAETLRGTVAERVMQSSGCPVLTVGAARTAIKQTTAKIEATLPVY